MKITAKLILWGLFTIIQLKLFNLGIENLTINDDFNMIAAFFIFIVMVIIMKLTININERINIYFNNLKQ